MMRLSEDEQIEQYYNQTGQKNVRELFTSAVKFLADTKQLDVDTQRYTDNIFEDETILTEFYNFLTKNPVPVETDAPTATVIQAGDPTDIATQTDNAMATATQTDADTGTRYNLSSNPVIRENQAISVVRTFVNELPSDVSKEEIRNKVMGVANSVDFNNNVSTTLSPFIVSGVTEVSGESITVEATPNSVDITGKSYRNNKGIVLDTSEKILESIPQDTIDGKIIVLHLEEIAAKYNKIYSQLKNQGLSDKEIIDTRQADAVSNFGAMLRGVKPPEMEAKLQLKNLRNSINFEDGHGFDEINMSTHEFLLGFSPKEAEVISEPTTNSMLARTSARSPDSLLGQITPEENAEIDAAMAADKKRRQDELAKYFIDNSKNILRPKKAEIFVKLVEGGDLPAEEYLRIAEEIGLDNRDVGGLLTILANNASV